MAATPSITFSRTLLLGIELRLLLEVADARAFGDPALAGELVVDAGHDAQQRRLARTVDPEHADLGVRVERQVDVLQHLAVRVGLGQTLHVIDELTGHETPCLLCWALAAKSTQIARAWHWRRCRGIRR